MSPDQINDLRARVLAGQPVSPEEQLEVIKTLRAGRMASATTKAAKKGKTGEAAAAEVDDILGSLGL